MCLIFQKEKLFYKLAFGDKFGSITNFVKQNSIVKVDFGIEYVNTLKYTIGVICPEYSKLLPNINISEDYCCHMISRAPEITL